MRGVARRLRGSITHKKKIGIHAKEQPLLYALFGLWTQPKRATKRAANGRNAVASRHGGSVYVSPNVPTYVLAACILQAQEAYVRDR